eukprot:9184760-Pyramimonas_sp.AAC.1
MGSSSMFSYRNSRQNALERIGRSFQGSHIIITHYSSVRGFAHSRIRITPVAAVHDDGEAHVLREGDHQVVQDGVVTDLARLYDQTVAQSQSVS